MNFFCVLFIAIAIYGGIAIDKSWFYILFFALGLFVLSLMFLINKIYYDENTIKFSCIYNKSTIKYDDIKEIFIQYDVITGSKVVFNLEKETNIDCYNYLQYIKLCKKENIKNTIFIVGISKKDLNAILKYCNCDKKGFYIS